MLYHTELGFPKEVIAELDKIQSLPAFNVNLIYSYHAQEQAYNKGINLPDRVNLKQGELIEVELDSFGRMVKCLWRLPYNDNFDLCLVITIDRTVKTVWLNNRTDKHTTLDRKKYQEVTL